MEEILAIVPARGGSKGIHKKNIIPLCNKPLLQYTIDCIRESQKISRAILSSDSPEIIDYSSSHGLEAPFIRPANFSDDEAPATVYIKHALEWFAKHENYHPDIVLILQPTSPLRTATHVDEAITLFQQKQSDSLVSVVEVPHNFNPYSVMKLEGDYVSPFLAYDEHQNLRQKKPKFYARNGAAIYAFKRRLFEQTGSIFGTQITPYFMSQETSIDIDSSFDLKLCEFLINQT